MEKPIRRTGYLLMEASKRLSFLFPPPSTLSLPSHLSRFPHTSLLRSLPHSSSLSPSLFFPLKGRPLLGEAPPARTVWVRRTPFGMSVRKGGIDVLGVTPGSSAQAQGVRR
eukprot:394626-Amorphochlora_amoeboformis.AAC.1